MRDSVKTRVRLQEAARNAFQRVLILASSFALFLIWLIALVVVVKLLIG